MFIIIIIIIIKVFFWFYKQYPKNVWVFQWPSYLSIFFSGIKII